MCEQKKVIYLTEKSDLWQLRDKKDGHFRLLRDIDMEGSLWNPVGNAEKPFTGTLDGNGFRIRNFRLHYPSSDGNLGFMGANGGTIKDLGLYDIILEPDETTRQIGLFAGLNTGVISRCHGDGRLTFSDTKASISCGGIVGVSTGTLEDVYSNADLTCTFSHGNFGGIAGTLSGVMRDCDCAAALTLTGADNNVGLLCGCTENAAITGSRYSGFPNTCNSTLITGLSGTQDNSQFPDCLIRDNSVGDHLLSKEGRAMRQKAVDHMYAMGTVPWTPDVPLHFLSPNKNPASEQYYPAGVQRFGLPYNQNYGSMERFQYSFLPNGNMKDFVKEKTDGFDGFDRYIGNDCSGAVYWAWCRIGCSFTFGVTQHMMPWNEYGVIPVGDYVFDRETLTEDILKRNGEQVMAECYAKLRMADSMVNRYPDWGHTRLCVGAPVVFRRPDGTISLEDSFIRTHEQGGNLRGRWLKGWQNGWLLDYRYTFRDLWNTLYIPVTIRELEEEKIPAATLQDCMTGLNEGSVTSNYRIDSTVAHLFDASGAEVWNDRLFTAMVPFEESNNYGLIRKTILTVDLADHAPHLDTATLESGKQYTYQIDVLLGNGETLSTHKHTFTA